MHICVSVHVSVGQCVCMHMYIYMYNVSCKIKYWQRGIFAWWQFLDKVANF